MKLPKDTEFQLQNEAQTLTIVEIESGDETEITVEYGLVVSTADDDAGKIKGSRYHCYFTYNMMGKDTVFSGVGVDVTKALDAMFTSFNRTAEEYEVNYDEEDDFFSQKYAAPKAAADDVWTNDKFKENREELNTLRGETEAAIATARDGERGTQDDYLKLAQTIQRAYVLVGNSRKALSKWAEGDGTGDNLQLLTQLGKGANSLTEAMRLAQISDLEYSVLPASMTSGKGVDTHGRVSIKQLVDNAGVNEVMSDVDTSADIADISGAELLVRQIAKSAFGIDNATETDDDNAYIVDLTELPAQVDEKAAEFLAEFNAKFGKSVNTYDSGQYTQAKLAYGVARSCSGGAGIFQHAVDQIEAYHAAGDDVEAMKKALDSGLFSKTGGNALVKEAYAQLKAHKSDVARDKAMAAAKQQAQDVDDTKATSTAWADLDPMVAAQWLNTRIAKHGKPNEVAAALRGLLADHTAPAAVAQAAE